MTVSELLKQARIDAGISQGELAKHLGYTSSQFVSNWERGFCEPPINRLCEIADFLSVEKALIKKTLMAEYEERIDKALWGGKRVK